MAGNTLNPVFGRLAEVTCPPLDPIARPGRIRPGRFLVREHDRRSVCTRQGATARGNDDMPVVSHRVGIARWMHISSSCSSSPWSRWVCSLGWGWKFCPGCRVDDRGRFRVRDVLNARICWFSPRCTARARTGRAICPGLSQFSTSQRHLRAP